MQKIDTRSRAMQHWMQHCQIRSTPGTWISPKTTRASRVAIYYARLMKTRKESKLHRGIPVITLRWFNTTITIRLRLKTLSKMRLSHTVHHAYPKQLIISQRPATSERSLPSPSVAKTQSVSFSKMSNHHRTNRSQLNSRSKCHSKSLSSPSMTLSHPKHPRHPRYPRVKNNRAVKQLWVVLLHHLTKTYQMEKKAITKLSKRNRA